MTREVKREGEGAADGECACSSLGVREWMLTMNSHGVEISIAWCVEEMVCGPQSHVPRVPLYRGSPLNPNPV